MKPTRVGLAGFLLVAAFFAGRASAPQRSRKPVVYVNKHPGLLFVRWADEHPPRYATEGGGGWFEQDAPLVYVVEERDVPDWSLVELTGRIEAVGAGE